MTWQDPRDDEKVFYYVHGAREASSHSSAHANVLGRLC